MVFAAVGLRHFNFATHVSKGSEQVVYVPVVGLQLNAYYNYGGSKHQWNVTVGDLTIALRVGPLPGQGPLPKN